MVTQQPDAKFFARMRARHHEMTVAALVKIFEWREEDADKAVYLATSDLPEAEREVADHEDPASLAAIIDGKNPRILLEEPYLSRAQAYDTEVRPKYTEDSLDDYNKNIKPMFDKLRYG
jgi:hypothetical protein